MIARLSFLIAVSSIVVSAQINLSIMNASWATNGWEDGSSSGQDNSHMNGCVHSNYQECAQLSPANGNPNPPSATFCGGGNYASATIPPGDGAGTWFGLGTYGLNCSCQGNYDAAGNDSEDTNPAPLPAIQWIQDVQSLEPYALVGTSGIFDIHGIALTAGGLTPQPQVVSDDPNITFSPYWAGVDNDDTDDSQINESYVIHDGARVGEQHTLTVFTAGGQASGTFGVYDNTPNILNCTANGGPCNFVSGNSYNVTVSGQYFGTAQPTVTITGDWGPGNTTTNLPWTITGWNDSTITGTISVPASDTNGTGTISLASGGYTGQGLGFDPAPQPQAGKTTWPATNTAPPPPIYTFTMRSFIRGTHLAGPLPCLNLHSVWFAGDKRNLAQLRQPKPLLQIPIALSKVLSFSRSICKSEWRWWSHYVLHGYNPRIRYKFTHIWIRYRWIGSGY